METPQQILKRLKINSDSYIKACLDMHEWENYKSIEFYKNEIANLVGSPCLLEFKNQKTAHLFFAYLVQETVKTFQKGIVPFMDEVWELAQQQALQFMKVHPFSTNDYKTENDERPESWQDVAKRLFIENKQMNKKELLALVSKEVDKSIPYINVFFTSVREEIGFVEAEINKLDVSKIDQLYKDNIICTKNEIMQKMASEFGLTPSMVTNHFYRCKKLYGSCKTEVSVKSVKSLVHDYMLQFKNAQTLNKNDICSKIVSEFNISPQTASAYFYQFIKQFNIQTEASQ